MRVLLQVRVLQLREAARSLIAARVAMHRGFVGRTCNVDGGEEERVLLSRSMLMRRWQDVWGDEAVVARARWR